LFPAVITSLLLHLNSCPSEVQPSTLSIKFYLLMVKGMMSELLISVRSRVLEESLKTVVYNTCCEQCDVKKVLIKWSFV